MKIIANIIANILRPKHRFLYTKKNGEQGIYIVTNCTAIKGSEKTSFSKMNLAREESTKSDSEQKC